MEESPHAGFIKEAFGAGLDLIEVRFNLQARTCAVVDIIGGVEAGEEDTVRFETAFEFRGDLQGDRPCEVVQGKAGNDHWDAVMHKGKRLAVIQLNDIRFGNSLVGDRQALGRKVRGDDIASRVQQFDCVPATATSEFENESINRFLLNQRNPFIEPGVFVHWGIYNRYITIVMYLFLSTHYYFVLLHHPAHNHTGIRDVPCRRSQRFPKREDEDKGHPHD